MNSNHLTTYLRLLSGAAPVPAPADYWAVPELINAGLATGHVLQDSSSGQRQVTNVLRFTPTVQGRLMADNLEEQARKRTWRHRLWRAVLATATFGAGWLAGVSNQVVANLLTKQLGG